MDLHKLVRRFNLQSPRICALEREEEPARQLPNEVPESLKYCRSLQTLYLSNNSSPVQSFLKSVTGYASLHPYEPNDESQTSWSLRSGVCGPIFALWFSVVQFHRSGVCGLIFAIWFSVCLDCGFYTLGFWFSLSWLLVPRFWFLCSLGLDFYVFLGFVSIFIFLCLLLFMLFDLVIFMFFFFFGLMFMFFYSGFALWFWIWCLLGLFLNLRTLKNKFLCS